MLCKAAPQPLTLAASASAQAACPALLLQLGRWPLEALCPASLLSYTLFQLQRAPNVLQGQVKPSSSMSTSFRRSAGSTVGSLYLRTAVQQKCGGTAGTTLTFRDEVLNTVLEAAAAAAMLIKVRALKRRQSATKSLAPQSCDVESRLSNHTAAAKPAAAAYDATTHHSQTNAPTLPTLPTPPPHLASW